MEEITQDVDTLYAIQGVLFAQGCEQGREYSRETSHKQIIEGRLEDGNISFM